MTQLYEGMFLLDNQVVREDWNQAKSTVTDLLAKHGGKLVSARRWDERRLAYPIKSRLRGTYLLAYFEQEPEGAGTIRRDLDLEERVLRYLILDVEALPEGELEHSQAELADDFQVPPVPSDDEPLPSEVEETEDDSKAKADDAKSEEKSEDEPAAKDAEEKPAEGEPAAEAKTETTTEATATAEPAAEEAKKES